MTKLLDQALDTVRKLPAASQNEIARAMLHMADSNEPEAIPPEHLTSVLDGLEQARQGQFATASEIEAAFRRFDR
jgi:Ca2+-binding EF-hand superfamily protein